MASLEGGLVGDWLMFLYITDSPWTIITTIKT